MKPRIEIVEPVGMMILNDEVMSDYLARSLRSEFRLDELLAEIEFYRLDGKVWEIFGEGKRKGIFWAKCDYEDRGGPVLKVGGVYVIPENIDRDVVRGIDRVLEGYARECDVKKIAFHTKRSGRGLERILGNGWRVEETLMTRTLK